jgi:hypothetical protein
MTLSDAHKTGKRIRRANSTWGTISRWFNDDDFNFTISMSDAIADDWEVEPEVYETTGSAMGRSKNYGWYFNTNDRFPEELLGKRIKLIAKVLD